MLTFQTDRDPLPSTKMWVKHPAWLVIKKQKICADRDSNPGLGVGNA
jgi:hypothetical protein